MIAIQLLVALALNPLLPCPLTAGWQLLWQQELPKQSAMGVPIGGFSGVQTLLKQQQIILLSDAPRAFTLSIDWRGSLLNPRWQLSEPQQIQGSPNTPLDGEALLQSGAAWWMVSEARDASIQPAELLQLHKARSPNYGFSLINRFPLPQEWQPSLDSGLLSNQGPEALVALPGEHLLMAAERPLKQDPPNQLRLLLAEIKNKPDQLQFKQILPSLEYQPATGAEAHWGLTELLAVKNDALLALWRGYGEPNQWWSRLELFTPIQLSAKTTGPLKPIAQWDLIALGLAPDNWEAMAEGPRLGDGRSTLLLASDDNFNPLQANRLALLAPLRSASCGKGRP